MALCQTPDCQNEAEFITQELDYKTICGHHLQQIQLSYDRILNIDKFSCLELIISKQGQMLSKLEQSLDRCKSVIKTSEEQYRKNSIQEIIQEIKDLVSISSNVDDIECRKIMIRLNYWNSVISMNNYSRFNIKSARKKVKMEKSRHSNLEVIKLLSNSRNNKVSIEKWAVTRDSGNYTMKIYIVHKEKYQDLIQKEIDFFCSKRDDLFFSRFEGVEIIDAGFEVLSEFNDFSFELGLQKVRYSEKEVILFLRFVDEVLRELSGNIDFYYLDPTMISYKKPYFKLTDFKYFFSHPVEKYLSIEYEKISPNLFQAQIFSAGLIVLEMLGCQIDGLNSLSCQSILLKTVDSLKISQILIDLLKKMLTYDTKNQINSQTFSSIIKSL